MYVGSITIVMGTIVLPCKRSNTSKLVFNSATYQNAWNLLLLHETKIKFNEFYQKNDYQDFPTDINEKTIEHTASSICKQWARTNHVALLNLTWTTLDKNIPSCKQFQSFFTHKTKAVVCMSVQLRKSSRKLQFERKNNIECDGFFNSPSTEIVCYIIARHFLVRQIVNNCRNNNSNKTTKFTHDVINESHVKINFSILLRSNLVDWFTSVQHVGKKICIYLCVCAYHFRRHSSSLKFLISWCGWE